MTSIVISIDRSKLPAHTMEQFAEWVRFCVGEIGSISMENPLHDIDMEASIRGFG